MAKCLLIIITREKSAWGKLRGSRYQRAAGPHSTYIFTIIFITIVYFQLATKHKYACEQRGRGVYIFFNIKSFAQLKSFHPTTHRPFLDQKNWHVWLFFLHQLLRHTGRGGRNNGRWWSHTIKLVFLSGQAFGFYKLGSLSQSCKGLCILIIFR